MRRRSDSHIDDACLAYFDPRLNDYISPLGRPTTNDAPEGEGRAKETPIKKQRRMRSHSLERSEGTNDKDEQRCEEFPSSQAHAIHSNFSEDGYYESFRSPSRSWTFDSSFTPPVASNIDLKHTPTPKTADNIVQLPDIGETLDRTGTLEMLILQWTNLTQEEILEE